MSKSLKKKNHWTNKVHEAVISRGKDGELGFELKGGAELGQFPYLGEVKAGKGLVQSGKLAEDELLLEVNDMPVAGLTGRDVLAVIKHCKDPVRFKCVKQGEWASRSWRIYADVCTRTCACVWIYAIYVICALLVDFCAVSQLRERNWVLFFSDGGISQSTNRC